MRTIQTHQKPRGFRVLRFWNNEILPNPDAALEVIWQAVTEQAAAGILSPSMGEKSQVETGQG